MVMQLSGIRQELHHYNHYRRCRTRLPTNRHKVYKYCHLIVVMVIELLVNSPYNAVMSGRLLEAGHSLLCLYYELLMVQVTQHFSYLTGSNSKQKKVVTIILARVLASMA